MSRPLADRDSAHWWDALTRHQLLLQRCERCDRPRVVPRAMCSACGSFDWQWHMASGRGVVISWTVSHRTFQADRTAPYVVVLVRLADGDDLVLPGGWDGSPDGTDLQVGQTVHADFVDMSVLEGLPACTLVTWRTGGPK